jgi:hypothetical protein
MSGLWIGFDLEQEEDRIDETSVFVESVDHKANEPGLPSGSDDVGQTPDSFDSLCCKRQI